MQNNQQNNQNLENPRTGQGTGFRENTERKNREVPDKTWDSKEELEMAKQDRKEYQNQGGGRDQEREDYRTSTERTGRHQQ